MYVCMYVCTYVHIYTGVNSFKTFLAYKGVFMLRDDEVIECVS